MERTASEEPIRVGAVDERIKERTRYGVAVPKVEADEGRVERE